MALVTADSDVLIDFINGVEPWASTIAGLLQQGLLNTTVISRFELLVGVRADKKGQLTTELLESLETLPLDESAANRAAAIQRELRLVGAALDMADCLIAGTVIEAGTALGTRNLAHFERIPGLALHQPS